MLLKEFYNTYASYSQTRGVHFQLGHSRLLSLCHQAYSHGRHTDPQRDIAKVSAMGSAMRSTGTSMWLADLQCSPQRAIKSAPVQAADA